MAALRLPKILLGTSGPSPVIMACQVRPSLALSDIIVKGDYKKGGFHPSVGMFVYQNVHQCVLSPAKWSRTILEEF